MNNTTSQPLWALLAESGKSDSIKGRVLVVDDEQDVAAVLARALAYAGYVVTVATNGQEALRRLSEHPFDLLLSDIYMPVLRGDELLKRALANDPTLAVLMITAIDDISCAVECLKVGAFDFLTKPFDISDVLVRVEKAMSRRHLEAENRDYRNFLEQRVAETSEQLRRTVQHSLESLIHTLEAKDPYTRNHSVRVADLSTALCATLYPGDQHLASQVRVAAIFHDIGKIGIAEHVLHKQGALTTEEFEMVRRHPVIGEAILAPMLGSEIVAIVRHHHEHWNGLGYPDGLEGDKIPLGARIVAVADSFDAMISERPHRPARSLTEVLGVLQAGAGIQWDAAAVQALMRCLTSGRPLHPATADLSNDVLLSITNALLTPRSTGETTTARRPAKRGPISNTPMLYCGSRIDLQRVQNLRQELEVMLNQHSGAEITLDLSTCHEFDDESAQALYALDLHARRLGGHLRLHEPSHEVIFRLRDAGLLEALKITQRAVAV